MNTKETIQKLHDKGIIDKRYVLWWQLGFEGRRVFSEEEFDAGISEDKWRVFVDIENKPRLEKRKFKYWTRDDVPILLREINICGIETNCFISVKPLSHHPKTSIANEKRTKLPFSIYHQPHIRGIEIDVTDRFLFWYPILFGTKPEHYSSYGMFLENENMWCLVCPIHPIKFYDNLICSWKRKGRRAQKKAGAFHYKINDFEVVPYYDFDPSKKHIMIYPVSLDERKLDTPIVIKSQPNSIYPEIVGAGYPEFDSGIVRYWELNAVEERSVKKALIKAFGSK